VAQNIVLAIDAMGGDHGPIVTVPAALDCLKADPQLKVILVGRSEFIEPYLRDFRPTYDTSRVSIVSATEVVDMDDKPSHALRNKKNSSMRIGVDLVQQSRAAALVSAGNTGALMAISRFVLKTLPGIDRPAIITSIPSTTGHFYMLDLGANVDCSAEQLHQFAAMGAVFMQCMQSSSESNKPPRVALLNIGEEEIKGNDRVKQAHALLNTDTSLNYVGYVEADSIFFGSAEVVVCDGFVGNVALKSMEGVAKMMGQTVKQSIKSSWYLSLLAWLSKPGIKDLKKRLDPKQHNGACMLGLKGTVVKSHGGADREAFANAIRWAANQVASDVPSRVLQHFESHV
jgi:glycerol-3-phosphate acyltransferase PlsX